MLTNRPKKDTCENSMKNPWVFLILGHTFWIQICIYAILKTLDNLQITILKMSQDTMATGRTCYPEVLIFLFLTANLTLHPNFSSPQVFFLSNNLGRYNYKGNHDYVFIKCQKHRSLE